MVRLKIAVVGGGVTGLAAAHRLATDHDVTLYEAETRLGGHTHTHDIHIDGHEYRVDTGFIVFSERFYPLFSGWLEELGVAWEDTDMSFSMRNEVTAIEYNPANLNTLFCQRRNLLSPGFIRMLNDIRKFYSQASDFLDIEGEGPTLGEFLDDSQLGQRFKDEHLVPMASALWSSPPARVEDFPIAHMVEFMQRHQMLELTNRPTWRRVKGGSDTYVAAFEQRFVGSVEIGCPVETVTSGESGQLIVHTADNVRQFDRVVLATHADVSADLLPDPAFADLKGFLGHFRFEANETILHTDESVMPARRLAWASWNARVTDDPLQPCTVTYWMNLLQGIHSPGTQFFTSLNQSDRIDPARVLARMDYQHPIFDPGAVAAQKRWAEFDGRHGIHVAGAWLGHGFHEDGVRAAFQVVERINSP